MNLSSFDLSLFDPAFGWIFALSFSIRSIHVIATQRIQRMTDVDRITFLKYIEATGTIGCLIHRFTGAQPGSSGIAGSLIPEVRTVAVEDKPDALMVERFVLKLPSGAVTVIYRRFNLADNLLLGKSRLTQQKQTENGHKYHKLKHVSFSYSGAPVVANIIMNLNIVRFPSALTA